MGKRLTIGSRAVAVAILAELLEQAAEEVTKNDGEWGGGMPELAERVVALAWDVEYKPNVERLVLTVSAGMVADGRMSSTPEDHPQ